MRWLCNENTYMAPYEGLAGVDGDVKSIISIRQVAPLLLYAVSVPQFQTAERCRVLLYSYLVDKHVWRRDHPLQVADTDVADLANPLATAPDSSVDLKRPVFGTSERLFRVRIA